MTRPTQRAGCRIKSCACAALLALAVGCGGDPAISSADNGGGNNAGTAGTGGNSATGGGHGGSSGSGSFNASWSDAGAPATNMPAVNPDDKSCGLQTFKLARRPAELMLVLDRSGSMNDPAAQGAATSKWTDVSGALEETIMKTESAVQWGVKAFPTGDGRCNVSDGVDVASAPMNYASMSQQIAMDAPMSGTGGGGTPTTLALQKAVAYLKSQTSANPRYLVLATDGEPNCAGGSNRGTGSADDANAIQAVADALTAGFKTFVIGVATGADAEDVLQQMAKAGGQARPGATAYYRVTDRADLVNALRTITGLVTDCVFHLDQPPPSPMDVAVNVGATRVTRDTSHADGWDYGANNGSIQFYGAACDQVKNAAGQNVQIIFGCPGVVIN